MTKKREEEQNQVALVTWFRKQYPHYAKFMTLGSIGENVGPKRMARLKQMGLTPGYPDLFLAVAMGTRFLTDIGNFWQDDLVHGLWIEMKSTKGRLSPEQKQIHEMLREANYEVKIAYSWDDAKKIIEDYLD